MKLVDELNQRICDLERELKEAWELNKNGLALVTIANDLAESLSSQIKELKENKQELQKKVLELKIELLETKFPDFTKRKEVAQ